MFKRSTIYREINVEPYRNRFNIGYFSMTLTALIVFIVCQSMSISFASRTPPDRERSAEIEDEETDQQKPTKHRVSINMGGLLSGTGDISVQRRLSRAIAINIAPTLIYWSFGNNQLFGGGLGIGIDYFPASTHAGGFHLRALVIPAYIDVLLLNSQPPEHSLGKFAIGAKVSATNTWIWEGGFSFSVGLGAQGYDFDERIPARMRGVLPVLEVGLGYAF